MPDEAKAQAKVDAAMDWHHGNVRQGCTLLIWNRVIAPHNKWPSNETLAKRGAVVLRQSLQVCTLKGCMPETVQGLRAGLHSHKMCMFFLPFKEGASTCQQLPCLDLICVETLSMACKIVS